MRHRLPAVLAALVVLTAMTTGVSAGPSGGAGAEQRASRPVVSVANTTGYLALPTNHQERFGTATVDVAGAAAMDSNQFRLGLYRRTTVAAFRAAPNATARTRLLREAANDLENMSQTLRRQQANALQAYNSGRMSTGTFLRRIAVIDARASRLDTVVSGLLSDVNREPEYTLPTRLRIRFQNLETEPAIIQGPVKSAVADSVAGGGPRQLYIGTTDRSYVFAHLSGGRYVREAFLAPAYGGSGPDQFRTANQDVISAATRRARTLYPWAFENQISLRARGFGLTPVYRFRVGHSHGRLTSYLDGRSNRTFREIQNKRLSRFPITETVTRRTENLTVRVNLTHPTGPMEVTVRDPDLNATVDARIRVRGTMVGTTGSDGSLWTIRPTGRTFVNASTADHSVELALAG